MPAWLGIQSLQLAPQGVVTLVYPPNAYNLRAVGKNVLRGWWFRLCQTFWER
jgi:hypothetical protein